MPYLETDIHGDQWAARLRAEHAAHAYTSHTGRVATLHTPDNDGWVTHLVERWSVAVHGGRALTRKLATRVRELESIASGERPADDVWRWSIDPAGSSGAPADRRASWRYIAERYAEGQDESTRHPLRLNEAEAMLDWPIYRQALADVVFDALWGQASEEEEKLLATLAHCAGIRPRFAALEEQA